MDKVEDEFICHIAELASIVLCLRPCQHIHWSGIPEVDAYCSRCGMDEFEVADEYENLWHEAMNLYYNV